MGGIVFELTMLKIGKHIMMSNQVGLNLVLKFWVKILAMLNFSEILLLVLIGVAIFKNFGLNLNLNDIKLISLSKNMDFPDTNDWSSITD